MIMISANYTPSNKENSPRNVTPQATRKIVHAMNVMNECPASAESFRAEVSTPDFF